jgi:hypothetical protein
MADLTYLLNADGSITCHVCGMTSHNPNDAQHLYCGHCHRFHKEARTLYLWVVYRHPADFPNDYVARAWDGEDATGIGYAAPTLEAVRELLPPGLHRLDRNPLDDAVIVETWL